MKKLNISAIESASILSSNEKKNIVGGDMQPDPCKTCTNEYGRLIECCGSECKKICRRSY
jgi:hypothetical protein